MVDTADPFALARFLKAQDPLMPRVLQELRAGEKRSHWMWFVFPQLAGLGSSAMAQLYAISTRPEALAYLAHPILGARLLECTRLVNAVQGRTVYQIFGSPDDLKFRSSMTLFQAVAPELLEFTESLRKFFEGNGDPLTIQKLSAL